MPFDANGQWVDEPYSTGRASDFDEGSADIPIWGWLTGASARRDAARNAAQQRRQERSWETLLQSGPTPDDLAVDYGLEGTTDEYGNLIGGRSQLEGLRQPEMVQEALQQLATYGRGGMTAADTAQANQLRESTAQQYRANNEAALRSAQARGMGGGGGQLAAQLSGSQAMAQSRGAQDAGIQQAIMQRALGALQAGGSLGLASSGQEMQRRQALDAYNQQQLDWRRNRGQRNTQWQNRTRESASNAQQQAYQNRERGVAGLTGQYQAGQQNRRQDAARKDQSDQTLAGLIGGVASSILGG